MKEREKEFEFDKPWHEETRRFSVIPVKTSLDIHSCEGLGLEFQFGVVRCFASQFDLAGLYAIANLFCSGESRYIELNANPAEKEFPEMIIFEVSIDKTKARVVIQFNAGFEFDLEKEDLESLGQAVDRWADKWSKRFDK
jgi:hypothetical protein